ncbi:MAG: chorismate mutase [Clostridiales bacterium]|nr:chorismate mutase [Clostridiales bacterium]
MRDLSEIRSEIDGIDEDIVRLYERRMQLSADVAEYKISTGKQVFDKEREKQKLAALEEMAGSDFTRHGIVELFEQIMAMSRKEQYQLLTEHGIVGPQEFAEVPQLDIREARVVFQGLEGAFSQEAMMQYFGEEVDSFHVDSFRDAMIAISDGSADYAVLPIENSTAGIVSEIYDLLLEYENYIVGEQVIRVRQCLMGVPGAQISDIRTVYSHPQSLMQSAEFLEDTGWEQVKMQNNAFAAKFVADEEDKSKAAIAGEHAAKIYGLEILRAGVNSSESNSTRFVILSGKKIWESASRHISICFEIIHESGSLYRALSHFIYNGLNMTNIQSRPIVGSNWEYRFFVEFEGKLTDTAVINALRGLSEETISFRILGTY